MKKIVYILSLLCLQIVSQAQTIDITQKPEPGPTPEIKIPEPYTFTLPNGLKVYVVENHKIPKVSMLMRLDVLPPLEKKMTGLSEFVGDMMKSGTKTKTKDQINNTIDGLGADLSISPSSIYTSSLTRNFDKMMSLTSDILLNSKFDKKEFELLKSQSIDGIKEAKDNPDMQVNFTAAQINFGPNHPYGEVQSEESLKAVTMEAVYNYYKTYFKPNVAYMAIVGDITPSAAKALVSKYFSTWLKGTVPVPTYDNGINPTSDQVYFISKKGAVQSNFAVTYPVNLKPGTPDAIPVSIANYILGGGSSSKLFMNLREGHGWTYGAYSSLSADKLTASFEAGAKCRNLVSDSAIIETLKEMKNMNTTPVTDEQLKAAKAYIAGSFSRGLESPQTIANYAINTQMYKLPKTYYKDYLKNLYNVSKTEVQDISNKYFHPSQANIIVSGNKEEVFEKLAQFDSDGVVEERDYLGRKVEAPKEVSSSITAESVIQDYINATGGEKAWRSIKDIETKATAKMQQGFDITMDMKRKDGDKFSLSIMAMGQVVNKQVFDGKKGYVMQQGQKQDLEESEIKDMMETANMYLDLDYGKLGYKLAMKGITKINGKDAYIIDITNPSGKTFTDYFDVATKYKVRSEQIQEAQGQSLTQTTDFSDYTEVGNGFKIPYHNIMTIGGQVIDSKITEVLINKNIPNSDFE